MGKRDYFIDGLKGLACFFIFIIHFNIAFSFCEPTVVKNVIKFTPLNAVIGENSVLVYLFCLLSGYVICRNEITTLKQLLLKIVYRYIRLVLPIFVAYLVVYLMGGIWGFPVTRVSGFVEEYELANYYQNALTLKTLFYEPFIKIWFSASSVITPLWMIRYVLYGSVLVYLYQYLCSKWKKGNVGLAVLFIVIITVLDMRTWLTLVLFLGAMLYKLKEVGRLSIRSGLSLVLILFVMVMTWCGHEGGYQLVTRFVQLPDILNWNGHWIAVYMVIFVWAVCNHDGIQRFFSAKGFQKLGKISFAVFLLHFPLICSFTMYLYFVMAEHMGKNSLYFLLFVITTAVLILLAWLFERYVEQGINRMLKKQKK